MHTRHTASVQSDLAMKILLCLLVLFCSAFGQDLSGSPRNFSIELLHFTAKQTGDHVVISPFGVWTLMTGIALGATGNSNIELRKAFILPTDEKTLVTGYKALTKSVLNPNTIGVSLTSTNFMFLDEHFVVYPEFLKNIASDFGASIKTLDFTDSSSAAKIANSHIQSNSGGRVANVLTSDDFAESRMILTNVISFKGLWTSPFNVSDTTLEPFYDENRKVIGQVNMMYQRAELPFSNIKSLQAFVMELPYGNDGKYSMLILLPHPNVKLNDMYRNLVTVSLKEVFEKLKSDVEEFGLENIDVRIPRFKISTNVVLNKPLNDMKVVDIFDPERASFLRVSKEPLFVSAIVHKADIEVTESGTVASASTSANFADRISTPSFLANRPFVYFIMEKETTTMIFGGIYSTPSVY